MEKVIIVFCCALPNHFMILLPGMVALKATRTTIVFPRMQEIQRTELIPNAVWRSMQDHLEGWPMKVKGHKKHNVKEKRSRKLRWELLALTMGVFLFKKNTRTTREVLREPVREIAISVMPMVSLKERNSTCLGTQAVLSALDQNSGRQLTHSMVSNKRRKKHVL